MGGETRYLVYAGGSVRLPYRQMDWQEWQAPFLCGLVAVFLTVGSSFAVVREAESPLQEKNPEENGIQLTEEQEIDSGEVASIGADTIEKRMMWRSLTKRT